MANEYVKSGRLLGRLWPPPPPQDSNTVRPDNKNKSKPSASEEGESLEIRKEKERVHYIVADFLRSGDAHIPGIFNPSQLAVCLGLEL